MPPQPRSTMVSPSTERKSQSLGEVLSSFLLTLFLSLSKCSALGGVAIASRVCHYSQVTLTYRARINELAGAEHL